MKTVKLAMALTLICGITEAADAAYKVSMLEVQDSQGSKIVITGSGSFNVDGLTQAYDIYRGSLLNPVRQWFDIGRPSGGDMYYTINAPAIFSNSSLPSSINATMPTGPSVGVIGSVDEAASAASDLPVGSSGLMVPSNYISGTELSMSTSVLWGTFSDYGLIVGRHEYSWGTGISADSMIVDIGPTSITAVPELSTWVTMLVGLGMVAGAARYRRLTTKIVFA